MTFYIPYAAFYILKQNKARINDFISTTIPVLRDSTPLKHENS